MTPYTGRDTSGPRHPPLTPAQRRALTRAAPETGEVRAGAATLTGLAALGLVRAYGRLGAHYLTAEGRALRESLSEPEATEATGVEPGRPRSGFSPATGDGPPRPERGRPDAVARAWRSLLEIRRLTGNRPEEAASGWPAPWERTRPVHAVALALEASGMPPSARDVSGRCTRTGYRVARDSAGPAGARVEWRTAPGTVEDGDHERLAACARALADCGWASERYTDSRRRPFLLVAPTPRGDMPASVRHARAAGPAAPEPW